MASTISEWITLNVICCAECGMHFAMPDQYERKRSDDHKNFYCPAGHSNYFPGESDKEKIARLQREKAHALDLRDSAIRAKDDAEAKAARLKKRVNAGVCPCCKRTFKQLAAHMKHQHPDYAK